MPSPSNCVVTAPALLRIRPQFLSTPAPVAAVTVPQTLGSIRGRSGFSDSEQCQPGEAGFKTVRIAPSLGTLRHVEATMPHPLGPIEVSLQRSGASGLKGSIRLPQGLTGEFVWRGKRTALAGPVVEIDEK